MPPAAMDFTKKFVRAKNPCAQGYRWFVRNHQKGGDYQQVLDALVEAGRVDDACWLLNQFGPTDAVLKLGPIEAEAMVFADVRGAITGSDSIRATQGILRSATLSCALHLDAGLGIKATESIVAGGSIRAGESLSAGDELRAGSGYGVFADLCVQHEAWETSAMVCASVRPERLMSGCWVGACLV